jgi:hypothetical protein
MPVKQQQTYTELIQETQPCRVIKAAVPQKSIRHQAPSQPLNKQAAASTPHLLLLLLLLVLLWLEELPLQHLLCLLADIEFQFQAVPAAAPLRSVSIICRIWCFTCLGLCSCPEQEC